MSLNRGRKLKKTLAAFVFCGAFLFILQANNALAYHSTSTYDKPANGTLSAAEWNNLLFDNTGGRGLDNLFGDFVNTWLPAKMNGPLGIATGSPADSGVMLDVNGYVRATGFIGPMASFLSARSVSSGEFGFSTGGGNYTFGVTNPGNVGIGVTLPQYNLDVSGIMRLSMSESSNAFLLRDEPDGVNRLRLDNNNKYLLFQESGGQVGIGTSTPNAPLDVNGLIKMRSATIVANEDVINKGYLDSAIALATSSVITQVATSSFWQGSLTGNIWNANTGNVGVGITNPGYKLDVLGNAKFGSVTMSGREATFANDGKLNIRYDDNAGGHDLLTFQNLNGAAGISHGEQIKWQFGRTGDATARNAGYLYLGKEQEWTSTVATNDSYFSLGTALNGTMSEKLRVNSAGNVGIGTTSPNIKLLVKDTGATYVARFEGSNSSVVTVGDSGLAGQSNTQYVNSLGQVWVGIDSAGLGGLTSTSGATGLAFSTAGNERVRINNSGNVGIGTTAPNDAFSIGNSGSAPAGSANTGHNYTSTYLSSDDYALTNYGVVKTLINAATSSSALWGGTTGGNIWNLNSANVGIGTASPSESKLQINSSETATGWNDANLKILFNGAETVDRGGSIAFGGSTYHAYGRISGRKESATNSNPGYLRFDTRSDAGTTEKMRITSIGNVGVGTTNPLAKLDVLGGIKTSRLGNYGTYNSGEVQGLWSISENYPISTVSNNFGTQYGMGYAYSNTGGAPFANTHQIVFTNSGIVNAAIGLDGKAYFKNNVGIGVVPSAYSLDVRAATVNILGISDTGATNYSRFLFGDGTSSGHFGGLVRFSNTFTSKEAVLGLYNHLNPIIISTNDVVSSYRPDLYINSSGNIGIGTTNPNDAFSIGNSGSAPAGSSNTGHNYTSTYLSSDDYALTNYGVVKTMISAATSSSALWGGTTGGNIWNLNSANVGIGTNNPSSLLNAVSGVSDFRFSTGASALTPTMAVINSNASGKAAALLAGTSGSAFAFDSSGHFSIVSEAKSAFTGNSLGTGTTLLRVLASGNVGIGTTNPSGKLHITTATTSDSEILSLQNTTGWTSGKFNQISFRDNSNIAGAIGMTYNTTSGTVDFTVNSLYNGGYKTVSSVPFIVKGNGNIGIGTTAPNDIFSIGNSGTAPAGSSNTGHNYTSTYLSSDDYALTNYGVVKTMISAATSSSALWGGTTGGNIWSLNSANVGIGTSSPLAKLDVLGSIRTTQNSTGYSEFVHTNAGGGSSYPRAYFRIYGGGTENNSALYVAPGNAIGTTMQPVFLGLSTNSNVKQAGSKQALFYLTNSAFSFITNDAENSGGAKIPWYFGGTQINGSDSSLSILANGNVGVGTTAPNYNLDVRNTLGVGSQAGTGGTLTLHRGGGNSPGFTIEGSTGLVKGASGYVFWQPYNYGNADNAFFVAHNTVGSFLWKIGTTADGTGGTEFMRLSHAGNLGIGTSVPNDTFSIGNAGAAPAGSDKTGHNYTSTYLSSDNYALVNYGVVKTLIDAATSSSALWGGTTGGNIWNLNSAGNVGIGTTSPQAKLDVNGGINFLKDINSTDTQMLLKVNSSVHIQLANNLIVAYKRLNFSDSGSESEPAIFPNNDYGVGMFFPTEGSNSAIGFTTGYSEKLRISNSGNVGIGTTLPNDTLSIGNAGTSAPAGSANTGHNYTSTYLSADDYALANYGVVRTLIASATSTLDNAWNKGGNTVSQTELIGTKNNYPIPFIVNNTEVMRLQSNGSVSIGAGTSTSVRLAVSTPQGPVAQFISRLNGGLYSGFLGNGNYYSGEEFGLYEALSGMALATYDYTNSLVRYGNSIAIDAFDNVGIGTTLPNDTLSIGNAGTSAPAGSANTGHNYTSTYLSADDYALANYGVVRTLIASATSTLDNAWNKGGNTVSQTELIGTKNNYPIPFIVNNTEVMRLQSNGSVSIGAGTSTSVRLAVSTPQGPVAQFISRLNGGLYSGFLGNGNYYSGEEFGLYEALSGMPLATYDYENSLVRYGNSIAIDAFDNVGIGTTLPNDTLSIGNAGTSAPAGSANTGHNYTSTYLSADDYALANYGVVRTLIASATSSSAFWGGDLAGSIWSLNNTNVGIGTTTPGVKLDVVGSVRANTFIGSLNGSVIADNVTSGSFGNNYGGGTYTFGGWPSLLGGGSSINIYLASTGSHTLHAPQLYVRQDDAETSIINTKVALDIHNDSGGQNTYSTLAFSSREASGAGNSVALAGISGWKISAGTANAWSQGGLKFWVKDNGVLNEAMTINQVGNIGVGTSSPNEKLTIQTVAASGEQTALSLRHALTGAGDNVAIKFWPAGAYSGMTLPGKIVATAPSGNNIGFNFVTNNNGVSNTAVSILPTGNVGIGTTDPGAFKLKIAGDVAITGALLTQTGSDFAEEFKAPSALEPGTVVVMGDEGYKSVKACDGAYDKTVVGIVSDNPSIIAGRTDIDNKYPEKVIVAMMGVVKVKVADVNGKITKGDLLTTSDMKGYAMRAKNNKQGTIIGKALEDLNTKTGEIKVLVNLQ